MKREELKKLRLDFEAAVRKYRAAVIKCFYGDMDDNLDDRFKKEVIRLFKETPIDPPEIRQAWLFYLLDIFSMPVEPRSAGINDPVGAARRLNGWLRELADELSKELKNKKRRQ